MKYRSIDTDFASLERELSGRSAEDFDDVDETPDRYADLAAQYEDYEDDEVSDEDEHPR